MHAERRDRDLYASGSSTDLAPRAVSTQGSRPSVSFNAHAAEADTSLESGSGAAKKKVPGDEADSRSSLGEALMYAQAAMRVDAIFCVPAAAMSPTAKSVVAPEKTKLRHSTEADAVSACCSLGVHTSAGCLMRWTHVSVV